jgi:hypothetical protein
MDRKKKGLKGIDRIYMTEDRDKWKLHKNTHTHTHTHIHIQ